MPYRTSSMDSLAHAQLVIEALGIGARRWTSARRWTASRRRSAETLDPSRLGNIMARTRMITLFDLSAAHRALPVGTGNKTERLLGYFTWHADDSPPVNPIGDLFKTQVWTLARHVGVPEVIVAKPASADLIQGQTDEGDFGISYPRADAILHWLLLGHRNEDLVAPRLHRGGDRPGPPPARRHPLEAPAPHRGDAERHGDRGVLSEAGGLLRADEREG